MTAATGKFGGRASKAKPSPDVAGAPRSTASTACLVQELRAGRTCTSPERQLRLAQLLSIGLPLLVRSKQLAKGVVGVLPAIAGLPTSMSVSSISPAVICSSVGWRRRDSMLCCTSGSRCSCGHSVCTVAPRSSANSTADFTAGPVPVTMTYKSKSCKMSKGCMRRCLCSKPMHICLKEPGVPSGPPGRDPPDVASFWQGTDIWTTFCVLLLQLEAGLKLTVVLQPALWRGLRAANKKFDLIPFWAGSP